MKKTLFIILLLVQHAIYSQQKFPHLNYTVVPDFILPPTGNNFGEVSSVAVNSKNHVFVLSHGKNPITEYDENGKFMRSFGSDVIQTGHSIRTDTEDNLWITDIGTHLVMKMNPEGRVVMILGRTGVAGEWYGNNNNVNIFDKPTDVAFAKNGDIYISDGYGNFRIMHFDKEGKFIRTWGKQGAAPGEFNTPHGIAVDANGLVYVADRENNRVQIFSAEGKFLKQWTDLGKPYSLHITPDQSIYLCDALNDRIVKVNLDGKVIGAIGEHGKTVGKLGLCHGLTVTPNGDIYSAELLNWRVQKFITK